MTNIKAIVGTNSWGSAIYEKILRGSAVNEETLKETIDQAVKKNLLIFDTAQDYGLGKGQKLIGTLCPEQIQISAKFTPSTKHGYESGQVRKSLLKDLQDFHRSYVDFYWLHLPNEIEENLSEMIQLYHEGRIKHIGISNFNLEECQKAKQILDHAQIPLYGVQNHYSLLERTCEKNGVLRWCNENDVKFWAWAVLEEGLLIPPRKGEKFTIMKFVFEQERDRLYPLYKEMYRIGQAHRLTVAQIAMAYVANKGIIPICGCRKPYQITQLEQAADTKLSASEIRRLEYLTDLIDVKILNADLFRFAVRK